MQTSYQSEEITTLAKALLEVQKEMQPATKDATNPFCKNRYATLNSVMESCREPLLAHGILLTQVPVPPPDYLGGGYLALMTKLIHVESGQWQASITVTPLPKADPQGMGSAITYSRRYALCAMLGIVTEDDDAESAKLPGKQAQNSKATNTRVQNRTVERRDAQPVEEYEEETRLPHLEGVTYQYATDQDGRQFVIASGNTQPKRQLLKDAGFRWNAQRKVWWKYADAA